MADDEDDDVMLRCDDGCETVVLEDRSESLIPSEERGRSVCQVDTEGL